MGKRSLVTLREIKEIKSIEGANNIEMARIDGWQCVVNKGEFNEGDIGIYFEVDSVLPDDERWGFLESTNWRIKTRKFMDVLSQGLLLPLDVLTKNEKMELKEISNVDGGDMSWNFDMVYSDLLENRTDLSEVFGVEKYVHPSEKDQSNDTKGSFPGFLKKTDQERIQNLVDEYEDELQYHPYEVTEKLEGTSITIYYNSFIDEFGVCSRNVRKGRSDHPVWGIVDDIGYKEKLEDYNKPIALQGELIGPKIQKNVYELDDHEFRIFDVWDIKKHQYMVPAKRYAILNDLFGDNWSNFHVPILMNGVVPNTLRVDDLLEIADDYSVLKNDVKREGIVYKSLGNPDVSFKVINNNYLLSH